MRCEKSANDFDPYNVLHWKQSILAWNFQLEWRQNRERKFCVWECMREAARKWERAYCWYGFLWQFAKHNTWNGFNYCVQHFYYSRSCTRSKSSFLFVFLLFYWIESLNSTNFILVFGKYLQNERYNISLTINQLLKFCWQFSISG